MLAILRLRLRRDCLVTAELAAILDFDRLTCYDVGQVHAELITQDYDGRAHAAVMICQAVARADTNVVMVADVSAFFLLG